MRCPTLAELPPPPDGKTGWPWTEETPFDSPSATAFGPDPTVNELPKITVVTPSYNQGQYLEETIRSVLLQGYPHLDYIVVDDCSTDDSVGLIRKYEGFLTWWSINDHNRGQSYTINRGFTHASGQLYAYLNSDDYYEPGALQACARTFQNGHQWIVGQVRFFQDGVGYGPVSQLPGQRVSDWFVCCPISQPGCFWSADLHHKVGPFRDDLHYFMDYEFWLRFRIGERIRPFVTDIPIAIYRLHPQSKTVTHNAAFAQEAGPIRAHYQRLLTPSQRGWLRVARRHRKARQHGSTAILLLQQGDRQSAFKELLRAFRVWPFCLLDLNGFRLALNAIIKSRDPLVASVIGPKWDD